MEESIKTSQEGKCTPCRSKAGNICCKQVKTTTRFKSQQKKKKLEDISQYKLWDRIYHLSYGVHNMQPTVCLQKLKLDWTITGKM